MGSKNPLSPARPKNEPGPPAVVPPPPRTPVQDNNNTQNPTQKSMLAPASRVTQKRSVQKGSTLAVRVGEKSSISSRRAGVVVSRVKPEARRPPHGARRVETRALLPMAGTSAALAVAL